ncbi:hypothetical protein VTI28DRAFT_2481 [Corynascus sepedonium]
MVVGITRSFYCATLPRHLTRQSRRSHHRPNGMLLTSFRPPHLASRCISNYCLGISSAALHDLRTSTSTLFWVVVGELSKRRRQRSTSQF